MDMIGSKKYRVYVARGGESFVVKFIKTVSVGLLVLFLIIAYLR